MRVVHVVQTFQPRPLERMVAQLALGCAARGASVEVVACGEGGPLADELTAGGVTTHVLRVQESPESNTPIALGRRLAKSRATHVHTHHLLPFLYASPASRVMGLTHVHTEHAHELTEPGRRRVVNHLMERDVVHVATSERGARLRGEASGPPSLVIEGGVPAPPAWARRETARELLGVPANAPVVMTVGALTPDNNHESLLRAFALVVGRVPNARLVVIGDGSARASLECQAGRLGLGGLVRFIGRCQDIGALVLAADVIAAPADGEDIPLAVLHGMAARVPFVTTSRGLQQVAAQGGGFVVRVGDDVALAARLLGMLEGNTGRACGDRAHVLWRNRFSVDAMIERYLALYRTCRPAPREVVAAGAEP